MKNEENINVVARGAFAVLHIVATVTGVSPDEIRSGARKQRICFARIILSHELQRLNLPMHVLLLLTGVGHHTTLIHHRRVYDTEKTHYFRANAAKVQQLLQML